MNPAVGYLRVSTRAQGESGLGLDAQRAAVEHYCRTTGHDLIETFCEIESGRQNLRPILREAIDRAKGARALLVIARLDRLSRSSRFIAELLESDLRFAACDVPAANRLVLQILAAVAEEEARATSIRTKQAMAAAKARGVVLGNVANFRSVAEAGYRGGRASAVARRRKRDATIAAVSKRIRELRSEGHGYRQIAAVLNAEHRKGAHGKAWRAGTVHRAARELWIPLGDGRREAEYG